jgi:hypothetical protein
MGEAATDLVAGAPSNSHFGTEIVAVEAASAFDPEPDSAG